MLRLVAGMLFLLASTLPQAAPAKATSKTLTPSQIKGPPKAKSANKLDTSEIHKTYIDGDFDRAIEMIEDAAKYGGPFTHDDSVFMFKHLGVMYAAKYETREKGKHFMLQLLNVEPTAKIMDMYASDMIYMIFKNIQDEFASSKPILAKPDPGPNPNPEPDEPKQKKNYGWVQWTAGAVAAAGGLALTFHLLDEAESASKEHSVHDQ